METISNQIEMNATQTNLQVDSEVLAALAHTDELRRARLDLDRKIIEGLESPMIPEKELDWKEMRRPILEATAKRGHK
jgi:hypothetical protein